MAVEFTINVGFHSYFWHDQANWALEHPSKIDDY